ncbi:hypothetical protein MD484_g2176, partial [Candolleomyces efflorescens]
MDETQYPPGLSAEDPAPELPPKDRGYEAEDEGEEAEQQESSYPLLPTIILSPSSSASTSTIRAPISQSPPQTPGFHCSSPPPSHDPDVPIDVESNTPCRPPFFQYHDKDDRSPSPSRSVRWIDQLEPGDESTSSFDIIDNREFDFASVEGGVNTGIGLILSWEAPSGSSEGGKYPLLLISQKLVALRVEDGVDEPTLASQGAFCVDLNRHGTVHSSSTLCSAR